jgi:hypothetical protein
VLEVDSIKGGVFSQLIVVVEISTVGGGGFLAVSSGFGDQVRVVSAWRVDAGVRVSLGV